MKKTEHRIYDLPDERLIATDDVADIKYMRVVLRDDQMEMIRQIVREEIRAALASGD